ncbi:diapolycopene oxygenase [Alkalibacterium subtropicum]|uniref:4,4'-diaponeurosporene oxygenase n=1 Tax=Alkalibacterium subtropicum TaxID=753702 RepID=A0A1I1GVD4_9LACT|nr:NAD(P)/FAD-dependent oxidoreductase [Alkalibacterium subtropicum]SFC15819.1 diapolycopene oxygenase [Alkalibacterium subtropicum]
MTKSVDVVVVGGGLGGLSAAISLAQKGYRVALYEKNKHLGGKLNRLEAEGFGFDLGPSILTMPHIFRKLFEQSSKLMEDYVSIRQLDHEWRSFFMDGTVLDLYNSTEAMLQKNEELSEKDIDEFKDYLDYTKGLYEKTEAGYFGKGLDTMKEVLDHHGYLSALKDFDYFHTMSQGIEKRISNPYLSDMLKYFIKYVGSSADNAPAILNVLPYVQYDFGLWYVDGGMHKLGEGLVRLAEEIGVALHTETEVSEILVDADKNVYGIQLATGETVQADRVVSNMEVIPAYDRLLHVDKAKITKLEEKFEPAASGIVLHLGVDREYPQLAHHNFFFSADSEKNYETVFDKHGLPKDPTIYLVNSNKTDPDQSLPGHENIKILPHIPYIQDVPFTEEDYARLRERVLIKLEHMGLTDLRKHIVFEDQWTPHDIEQHYYSNRGAIYGVVSDRKKNKGFKFPKKSQLFNNLYFAGGSVNPGGGMPMVTLSGQQVSDIIEKEDRDSKR